MRKQIQTRRARNAELAKRDAANRCAYCKLDLATTGRIVDRPDVQGRFFCTWDCVWAHIERDQVVGR